MTKHLSALCIAAALLLSTVVSSCTTQRQVVSLNGYERTVALMAQQMAAEGYMQTGAESTSTNQISVDKTVTYFNRYGRETGYSQKMKNNLYYHNVYTFADSLGNQATVTTLYKPETIGNTVCLEEYALEGCKTSLPQDYARICSGGGPVSRNLSQLYTDTTVEDLDYLKSSLILAGGAAVLGVLLLVLLGE